MDYIHVMGKLLNLIDKKFGKLSVVERMKENNSGFAVWRCLCECGNYTILRGDSLRSGNTKSCGKCIRGKNELHKRYGRLKIIGLGKKFKNSNALVWLCRCDCGNEVLRVGSSLRNNKTASCGCLWRERIKESNGLPDGEAAKNKIISQLIKSAKKRNIECLLTREQILDLAGKNCHYCNIPPNNLIRRKNRSWYLKYNGIDRVDNNKGYIISNVVTCCWMCNHAKTTLTKNGFLSWIERVYKTSIQLNSL